MSPESRQEQFLLSIALGPLAPLFGVVETENGLACECGRSDCTKPGKHPRWRNYRRRATSDPCQLRQWMQRYPHANFAVITGATTIALDIDVRSDSNGLATLQYLEIDVGERLPDTVEVITGRENGSRHLFFKTPREIAVRSATRLFPGVDVRATGGYCVAAGSRHICGGYYQFAEDCRPDEQALADLPDFLVAALAECSPGTVILGPQMAYIESVAGVDTDRPTDALSLPDAVVLGVLLRDRVARFYWNGGRRNLTPSEDDFALACKLAFYCRHDLQQMYRLFMRSGLRRKKFSERRPGGDYALWTLKHAIKATPQTWIPKKRKRRSVATGAKKGRRISPSTVAILDLHLRQPEMTARDIAIRLDLKVKGVRDALYYHRHRSAENTWSLIHGEGFSRDSQEKCCLEPTHQAA